MEEKLAACLHKGQISKLLQDHAVKAGEEVGHPSLAAGASLSCQPIEAPPRMQALAIAMTIWLLPVPIPPTRTAFRGPATPPDPSSASAFRTYNIGKANPCRFSSMPR